MTSVFGGPILKKLRRLDNVRIFEPFSILLEQYYKHSFYNALMSDEDLQELMVKFGKVQRLTFDEESLNILSVIKNVIQSRGEADNKCFFDIASDEDCYFIEQVKKNLPASPTIIDCGGFTGDLMVALKKHGIDDFKVYSFEPNKRLLDIMNINIANNRLEDKFFAFHMGVWDKSGTAFLNFDENDIAGGNIKDKQAGEPIKTISIDEFFRDIHVDFIKMDIEGAELNALRGGINVIRRDRPILAISLYHSVNDVVDIPLYLNDALSDYRFLIRHHSLIGSETVLYGIPQK